MTHIPHLPEPRVADQVMDTLRDMTDTINKLIEAVDWLEYRLEIQEENR